MRAYLSSMALGTNQRSVLACHTLSRRALGITELDLPLTLHTNASSPGLSRTAIVTPS